MGYTLFAAYFGPTRGTIMARNYDEFISFLIVAVPLSIVLYYATLALTLAIAKKSAGSSPSISSVYKKTLKRFPSAFGAYVLTLFPLAVAVAIVLYLSFRAATQGALGSGSLLSIGIGIGLFVIGFIMFMWFSFSHLAALLDDRSPLDAVKYSYSLVHRRLGPVMWRLLAPAVILSLFAVVLGDVLVAIAGQIAKQSQEGLTIINAVISTAIAMIIGPWGYAISIKLYEALKKPRS